jgi:MurNAc alpha-1-phosphate uridylyltransferase
MSSCATDVQCVILAGGRGTRMAPHTDELPKALLPVAGRPFADWQLRWLATQGVEEVIYSIGHLGDLIRRHVGDGEQWGLRVHYVDEGAHLRGTGGALRKALEESALAEQFLVLYGDSYLSVDVRSVWAAFAASGSAALMSVYLNEGAWERSNAVYSEGMVTRYEKGLTNLPSEMRYVDYGLSVFERSTVDRWMPHDAVIDLADTFRALSAAGELAGYEARGRFYEIGSPDGLRDLEAWLLSSPAQGETGVSPPSRSETEVSGTL